MLEPKLMIDGIAVPRLIYGTAWKEDSTQRLTEAALRAGFRGIDTANQRKHYVEAEVGRAIAAAIETGDVQRDDLLRRRRNPLFCGMIAAVSLGFWPRWKNFGKFSRKLSQWVDV